jgi:hypothetical protein
VSASGVAPAAASLAETGLNIAGPALAGALLLLMGAALAGLSGLRSAKR